MADILVDSHCHAWPLWPYEPAVPDSESRGSVEQLLWEMDQSGVAQAVLVAANIERNPENNAYVHEQVKKHRGRLHHFAHIDCHWEPTYNTSGAAERLDRLLDRYEPAGVTKYLAPEPDDWLFSPDGMAFLARVAERGVILSLSANARWHARVARIAHRFPAMPIMLHHIGSIRTSRVPVAEALKLMQPALECDNVYVKLSGFYYGSERKWDFPMREVLDAVEKVHRMTGSRRLCWGSDYPVVKRDRSFTYQQTIECVREYCRFIPETEMPMVLGGTLAGLLGGRGPR